MLRVELVRQIGFLRSLAVVPILTVVLFGPAAECAVGQVMRSRPREYWQARMALLVLRSSAEGAPTPDGETYVIPPLRDVLNREQAILWLAKLQKPVLCVAEFRDGSYAVGCRSVAQARLVEAHQHLSEALRNSLLDEVRSLNLPESWDHLILVQGSGESFLIPIADIEAFGRKFLVFYGSSSTRPDANARLQGAISVWTIFRPGEWWSEGPGGAIKGFTLKSLEAMDSFK